MKKWGLLLSCVLILAACGKETTTSVQTDEQKERVQKAEANNEELNTTKEGHVLETVQDVKDLKNKTYYLYDYKKVMKEAGLKPYKDIMLNKYESNYTGEKSKEAASKGDIPDKFYEQRGLIYKMSDGYIVFVYNDTTKEVKDITAFDDEESIKIQELKSKAFEYEYKSQMENDTTKKAAYKAKSDKLFEEAQTKEDATYADDETETDVDSSDTGEMGVDYPVNP